MCGWLLFIVCVACVPRAVVVFHRLLLRHRPLLLHTEHTHVQPRTQFRDVQLKMAALLVLYETAVGYGLFEVIETEEIGLELDAVQEATNDLARFGKVVKLKAFVPFRTSQDALENINQVSEGMLPDLLKDFLEQNLPKVKSKKKAEVQLGVSDHRIGSAIVDGLGFPCVHTGIVPELVRGIRRHFPKLLKSVKEANMSKAQQALAHSYSRAKVKFNVNRVDNMIIQAICLLDQLDKDVNTFSMRIREWYSYHFPELVKIVPDNKVYARLVAFIGRRTTLTEDSIEKLEELTMNSATAQQVYEASKTSMGMDISDIDLLSIDMFAKRVMSLSEYRQELHEYLQTKMHDVAPNLSALIGEAVGARLISHAGSLSNLAKYPASTVQILGAEKALFRALKTRGNTPKYGLIFHSTFIGRAAAKNKGRISRYLANKCSIASRIDCFSDNLPGSKFGDVLRDQVEERLNFYETGEAPRKNLDVMREVIATLPQQTPAKKTKRKAIDDDEDDDDAETPQPKSGKKKKKKSRASEGGEASAAATPSTDKKKKKKKRKSTSEA
eukprot:m.478497 g.478497  ORF g.478497 m.478497 type:complete len:555 (-) comp21153_c0_seq1:138-1802(-)